MFRCIRFVMLSYILVLPSLNAQDQSTEASEFWLTFQENLTLEFNGDPQFALYIDAVTTGIATIEFPATGLKFEFPYVGEDVTEIILPNAIYYSEASELITNKGMKVSTSTPVELTAFHYRIYFSEATKVLPAGLLASEYYTTCFLDLDMNLDSPSSFVILATEDGTDVQITPTANTAEFRPKDVPFQVTLNAGQTYEVQSLGDLTGSHIRAMNDAQIAVFNGALKGNVACGPADSHMYDQQLPVKLHGTDYALIPFANQENGYFRVVSFSDGNTISINGNEFITLDVGEYADVEVDEASVLTGTSECSVAQLAYSYECASPQNGDPNLLQLYPLTYRNQSFSSVNTSGFENFTNQFANRYITLISTVENSTEVMVDNLVLNWQAINGSENYVYSIIESSSDISKIDGSEGVQAYAYGFGEYDAYTYSLGFDRADLSATVDLSSDKIEMYPNPAIYSFSISSMNKIESVTILNQLGQVLQCHERIGTSYYQLDISEIPSGILTVQIETDQGMTISPLVNID